MRKPQRKPQNGKNAKFPNFMLVDKVAAETKFNNETLQIPVDNTMVKIELCDYQKIKTVNYSYQSYKMEGNLIRNECHLITMTGQFQENEIKDWMHYLC